MENSSWHGRFSRAKLHNLVAFISDHNPILHVIDPIISRPRRYSFKFETRWLFEKDLSTVIRRCWDGFGVLSATDRLAATAETLSLWGRKADLEFRVREKELEKIIQICQARRNASNPLKLKDARSQLSKLLNQRKLFGGKGRRFFGFARGILIQGFSTSLCPFDELEIVFPNYGMMMIDGLRVNLVFVRLLAIILAPFFRLITALGISWFS